MSDEGGSDWKCRVSGRYRVAYFKTCGAKEEDVHLLLALLDPAFTTAEIGARESALTSLQVAALRAGLKGLLIPIWVDEANQLAFIAPESWHPFLRGLTLESIQSHIVAIL